MRRAVFAVLAVCLFSAPNAYAGTIAFTATDLVDTTPGDDLWQYDYAVTGFNFLVSQGFLIQFDDTAYRDLQNPAPAVHPDWDILTIQPDIVLHSPGTYDALALVTSPSLANHFRVSVVWLGGPATPGVQTFVLYELDPLGALTVIGGGQTVPATVNSAVPEPSSLFLVGAGVLTWVGRLARRRRHRDRSVPMAA